MTQGRLSKDDIAFLKTATRRLVRAAGGIESAAMVTRVGKSALSDYQNPELPDHFMPIDVVAELEGDTGAFHVTQALCRLSGGYFVRGPAPGSTVMHFSGHLPQVGKEIGDIWAESARALVDGAISEEERQRLIAEIEGGLEAMISLRNALETAQTGKK